MKYLIDANVWLQVLLEQAQSEEARRLLGTADPDDLAITDFALFSIAIILIRLGKDEVLAKFAADILDGVGLAVIRLDPADLAAVLNVRRQYGLDFDDAYHYHAATKHGLTLVSYDADFDRIPGARRTPAEVLPHV